jgi:hypothetical protein
MALGKSDKISILCSSIKIEMIQLPVSKIMASQQQKLMRNTNYKLPSHNKSENQIAVIIKSHSTESDFV